ncbi:Plasmodium vivax Vir protein, putative [Plasmodium vivax]|uniref:Vir protein, putative n=1 Tax=Plasmodium vivax TaxID=5855 RepID=A0A1G4EDY4_PLAVI|nr:Plasmodium vivax Vir protein, putative [Plasmodium vivax]
MYEPDIDYYEGVDKPQIKDLLKNVTLYKLYNTIENELKIKPVEESCNESCGAILQRASSDVSKLLELCKGICNIISKAKSINGFCSEKSCSDAFIHMSIWLYERVEQITSSDSEIKNFYEVLTSIMQTKGSHLEKCSIINFNKGKNGFKDMKYLYEFLHICDNIKDEISEEQNEKSQLYCTYIKEFFRYYNTIEGNCTAVQNKPIYCNVIDRYKWTLIQTGTLESINNKCNFDKVPCESDTFVKTNCPCLQFKENSFKNQSQSVHSIRIIFTHENKKE